MLITLAGGLAANLLTVLVVAVAVIFARVQSTNVVAQIQTGALQGIIVLVIIIGVWAARKRRKRAKIFLATLLSFAGLISLADLLGWLGQAAGIK